jgi:hypothetical protein
MSKRRKVYTIVSISKVLHRANLTTYNDGL